MRYIIHIVKKLELCKLTSLHEILPADNTHKEIYLPWSLSKATVVVYCIMDQRSAFYATRRRERQKFQIWATSNLRKFAEKQQYSIKGAVLFVFMCCFISEACFFECVTEILVRVAESHFSVDDFGLYYRLDGMDNKTAS